MLVENYREFRQQTLDYISHFAVSDEFWDKNKKFIQNLLFEYYQYHIRSGGRVSTKDLGKLLEINLSLLNKFREVIKLT